MNQRLARLYGLPFTSTGAPFSPAEAPMDQQRIGIITQPAFLWALSDPAVTSIVKRGKFIHDDVLCVDPGPPRLFQDPRAAEPLHQTAPAEVPHNVLCLTKRAYERPCGA